jgi:hypothetical protein
MCVWGFWGVHSLERTATTTPLADTTAFDILEPLTPILTSSFVFES